MRRLEIRIEERQGHGRFLGARLLALSLLAGFACVGAIFMALGIDPLYAFARIFAGCFGSEYGIKETLTKAIPLILIASGLTVVFRAKFWNIGAEGQLLAGATAATWVGLGLGEALPGPLVIALMAIAAACAGALWGLFPVLLKLKLGVNEVISTLMLNYIAAEIVSFLVIGPWKGPSKYGYPYTDDIPAGAQLGFIPGSRIHYVTLTLALLTALALFYLLFRTRFGYEARVIGENREAAKYAGIRFLKTSVIMMLISGGAAGLAGFGEIAGIHHHLTAPSAISGGYGFTAIIVAWLGKLNPLLAVVAGIFFAGIVVGGDAIQISLGLPASTVQVFNGVILIFLIMGDYFTRQRVVARLAPREGSRHG
jgi:simple sugar transport system permease protein